MSLGKGRAGAKAMWVQPLRSAAVEHVPPRTFEAGHRVAVLLNSNARKVTEKVVRSLSHVVPEGDLYLSRSELDARRIAHQVIERQYHTVFLGGGDGTVMCFMNEIMNQVAVRRQHQPVSMPALGVLKLGTGNSVASLVKASSTRGDGILDDVLKARAGEVPGYRTIDMLMIDGKRAPFAGLGIDGKVLNDYITLKNAFAQGPFSKVLSGAGGYFTSVAFKTVPYYLTHSTEVECEVINNGAPAYRMGEGGLPAGEPVASGGLIYKGSLMMAAAGTVPFYGFELKMFPFAGKRRGMMNLRLATIAPATVLANLPSLWRGQFSNEGIRDILCSDATIRFSRAMPFQIAGDAVGYRDEVRFQMCPDSVDLVDFSGALH